MQIIRDIATLRLSISELRQQAGGKIALVPTMGALHEGHMTLVREARNHVEHVVASVFVNPTQFGPSEDLDAYPRREAEDAAMLEAEGVAILWAPTVAEMYPQGFATTISVGGVSEPLEGAHRPGHFDGVATVVAKLLGQVRPDVALFGEKDYQQLAVIRRMVLDLNLGVAIAGVATVRDGDGLALSSRNAYLTADERAQAVTLPNALREAVSEIEGGGDIDAALARVRDRLAGAGFGPVDYVELCDSETLSETRSRDRPARLLAAARLGITRLIDNFPVKSVD